MTPRSAGLALAAAHLVLVGSVALRFTADRARLPRGWARTVPFDPSLPIRGRYVRLRLQFPLVQSSDSGRPGDVRRISLRPVADRIEAVLDSTSLLTATLDSAGGQTAARLDEPVAFFIPEHLADPSIRGAGEELWAEVTIPRRGPPRPVRLGVRTAGGLEPLEIR